MLYRMILKYLYTDDLYAQFEEYAKKHQASLGFMSLSSCNRVITVIVEREFNSLEEAIIKSSTYLASEDMKEFLSFTFEKVIEQSA